MKDLKGKSCFGSGLPESVYWAQRSFEWGIDAFGSEVITDVHERIARILEEAIELYQAEGGGEAFAQHLVKQVFARPVGDPQQELAGVMVTTGIYACLRGFDRSLLEVREIHRVVKKLEADPSYFRSRQNEKHRLGMSMPTKLRPGEQLKQAMEASPSGEPKLLGFECCCEKGQALGVKICPDCSLWANNAIHLARTDEEAEAAYNEWEKQQQEAGRKVNLPQMTLPSLDACDCECHIPGVQILHCMPCCTGMNEKREAPPSDGPGEEDGSLGSWGSGWFGDYDQLPGALDRAKARALQDGEPGNPPQEPAPIPETPPTQSVGIAPSPIVDPGASQAAQASGESVKRLEKGFEHWARSQSLDLRWDPVHAQYENPAVQGAWRGWCAAWACQPQPLDKPFFSGPSFQATVTPVVATSDGLTRVELAARQRRDEILATGAWLTTVAVPKAGPGFEERQVFRVVVNGASRYPAWQFYANVLQEKNAMSQLLSILPDANEGWVAAFWLYQPNRFLDGRTPVDEMKLGDPSKVVEAAKRAFQPTDADW